MSTQFTVKVKLNKILLEIKFKKYKQHTFENIYKTKADKSLLNFILIIRKNERPHREI